MVLEKDLFQAGKPEREQPLASVRYIAGSAI